jgi:hypothetical protein
VRTSDSRRSGQTGGKPFDHLLLVARHRIEVQRLRSFVRRVAGERGALLDLDVEHEADGSCCAREPWPVTLLALLFATVPAGGQA